MRTIAAIVIACAICAALGLSATAAPNGLAYESRACVAVAAPDGSSTLTVRGVALDGALVAEADLGVAPAESVVPLYLWPYGAREQYPVVSLGDGRYVIQGGLSSGDSDLMAGLCIGWRVNPAKTLLARVILDNSSSVAFVAVEVVDLGGGGVTSVLRIPVRPFLENLSSHLAWAPGDTLYFDIPDERGWGIWVWRPGSEASPVMDMARHPEVDPNGRYLAYQAMTDRHYPEVGPAGIVDLQSWAALPCDLPSGVPAWLTDASLAVLTPDGRVTMVAIHQGVAAVKRTVTVGGVLAYPSVDSKGLRLFSISLDTLAPSVREVTIPLDLPATGG